MLWLQDPDRCIDQEAYALNFKPESLSLDKGCVITSYLLEQYSNEPPKRFSNTTR